MSSPYSAAVVDGVLHRLSVSQVTSFDAREIGGCQRRWYFNKVKGMAEPETKSQADGKRFHKEIEDYLTTGDESKLSYTTKAGLHLMPKPGHGISLEVDMIGLELAGIDFAGRVDCINRRGEYINSEGELMTEPGRFTIEVIDWKSTADARKYAKTGAALGTTPQMLGYAEYIRRITPGLGWLRLSHVYFQKGKPDAIKSTAVFSVDTIKERWQSLVTLVNQMKAVAGKADATQVEPNYGACEAFKGCPFKALCPRTATDTINALFGESKMGLFGKKPVIEESTIPPAPVRIITNPPGPVTPADAATIKAAIAELKKEEIAPKGYGQCKACKQEVTAATGSMTMGGTIKHFGCPASIVAPDAPKSEGANSAQALDGAVAVAPVIAEAAAKLGLQAPASGVVTYAIALPAAEATKPEPKKRAKKTEPVAVVPEKKITPEAALMKPAGSFDPVHIPGVLEETTAPATVRQQMLIIGGSIKGVSFIDADALVAAVAADVCKKFGVADLRLAPAGSPLCFGGWKGALAIALREDNSFQPLFGAPSIFVLSNPGIFDGVAVEVLAGMFDVIVRA